MSAERRPEAAGAAQAALTDLHSHLVPGVDDGAADEAAARAGVRELYDAGVRRIATTPHVMATAAVVGNPEAEQLGRIDARWDALAAIAAEFPGLELLRGAEVMLDTPAPDLADPRLRLGGTAVALVEFPYLSVPPSSGNAITHLRNAGWIPLLAHPERYAGVNLRLAAEWRQRGAYLQVNGRSLLGRYGREPKAAAFALLQNGLVDCVGSDYHARGACGIPEYGHLLREMGEEQMTLLLATNPARLLAGEAPIPVGPLRPVKRGFWSFLRGVGV